MTDTDLPRQVAESGANAVLVAPQFAYDAADSSPGKFMRPGAFARGRVEVGKGRRSMVPQTAILSDLDGNYVYVVDPQGVVQRRNVNVAQSRPEGVVIASGLADGERVVSTAGAYLRPGEKVRLAKE